MVENNWGECFSSFNSSQSFLSIKEMIVFKNFFSSMIISSFKVLNFLLFSSFHFLLLMNGFNFTIKMSFLLKSMLHFSYMLSVLCVSKRTLPLQSNWCSYIYLLSLLIKSDISDIPWYKCGSSFSVVIRYSCLLLNHSKSK